MARLVLFALVEPFGYRQFTALCRLQSFWRYLRGDARWGTMGREGFAASTRAPVARAA